MMHHLRFFALNLVVLFVIENHVARALADQLDQNWNAFARDSSATNLDEGSCICGLDRQILDKIETIVKHASSQAQSCSILTSSQEQGEINVAGHSTGVDSQVTTLVAPADDKDGPVGTTSVSQIPEVAQIGSSSGGSVHDSASSSTTQNDHHESLIAKLTEEIKALEAQLAGNLRPHDQHAKPAQPQQSSGSSSSISSTSSSSSAASTSTSTWRPTAQQQQQQSRPLAPITVNWEMIPPSGSSQTMVTSSIQHETGDSNGSGSQESSIGVQEELAQSIKEPDTSTQSESERPQTGSSGGSFLQGLSTSSVGSSSSLSQGSSQDLNGVLTSSQSGARPTIQTVQSTLATTVPNVVSNIFSNIQNLAIQTEQNPDSSSSQSQSSNYLTSIDGSSIHLSTNETADEITAQGEMLFMQWVDHQIQALHVTASMASYIRKSALSLFRRIARQYVERIGKLGGRVEDNVRKATQIALNNTQNLTSFLLRNYLNVAGGLMQIIGEQVSRVGKQLDSTGETIANINLNPFDIVSNVLASLPNPARYSEYFRAFGKYLMGEQDTNNSQQQQQSQYQNDNERRRGLLSKTMGALGKTLGTWLG